MWFSWLYKRTGSLVRLWGFGYQNSFLVFGTSLQTRFLRSDLNQFFENSNFRFKVFKLKIVASFLRFSRLTLF